MWSRHSIGKKHHIYNVQAIENKFTIIVVEGSELSNGIIEGRDGPIQHEEERPQTGAPVDEDDDKKSTKSEKPAQGSFSHKDPAIMSLVNEYKFYRCKNSSEELASMVHLFLTMSLL